MLAWVIAKAESAKNTVVSFVHNVVEDVAMTFSPKSLKQLAVGNAGDVSSSHMSSIIEIVLGVVVLIVGLVLFPTVLSSTSDVVSDGNIGNFTGTSALVKLVPLLYTVVILGIAGGLTYVGFKSFKK